MQTRWAGTLTSIGPSTAHQARLDLQPGVDITFAVAQPEIALHQWHNGGPVTHLSYVGAFDGTHPFE